MGKYIECFWAGNDDGLYSGRDREPGAYLAYVPDFLNGATVELPESISGRLHDALRDVVRADSSHPATAKYLNHLLLRSESIDSSYIEGFQVTPKRLAIADSLGVGKHLEHTVLRNVRITQKALTDLGNTALPITIDGIVALQSALVEDRLAGVRREQNWVGGTGNSPRRAAFVPPPPELVNDLLLDLVKYANRTDVNPILQAALVHAQFETIHPFPDGNGRTGRALIQAILRRRGIIKDIVLPVSSVFAKYKDHYIQGLNSFRGTPQNYAEWVSGFVEAVHRSVGLVQELATRIDKLSFIQLEQLKKYREDKGIKPSKPRSDAVSLKILDSLATNPIQSIQKVTSKFGVSWHAADSALSELAAAGVLKPFKDQKGNIQAFTSDEHLNLVTLTDRSIALGGVKTRGQKIVAAPPLPKPNNNSIGL